MFDRGVSARGVRSAHAPTISRPAPWPAMLRFISVLYNHAGSCMIIHGRRWSSVLSCTSGAVSPRVCPAPEHGPDDHHRAVPLMTTHHVPYALFPSEAALPLVAGTDMNSASVSVSPTSRQAGSYCTGSM